VFGAVISTLGAALTKLNKNMLELSAAYESIEISSRVVSANVGSTATAFDEAADSIRKQGYSYTQAYKIINQLSASQLELADITKLAGAANDIAAAKNLEAVQVYEILARAISSASAITLRQLEIGGSAEDVFKNYADSIGIAESSLDDFSRRQAVFQYIMERSSNFLGTYTETLGTARNKTRELGLASEDLQRSIGDKLSPAFKQILDRLRDFVDRMLSADDSVKMLVATISAAGTAFASLVGVAAVIAPLAILIKTLATGNPVLISFTLLLGAIGIAVYKYTKEFVTSAYEQARASETIKTALDEQIAQYKMYVAVLEKEARRVKIAAEVFWTSQIEDIEEAKEAVDDAIKSLQRSLWRLEDTYFDLDTLELALDNELQPLKDALFLIEAKSQLILIPLKKQRDLLKDERDIAKEIAEAESERLDKILEGYKDRIEAMRELVSEQKYLVQYLDYELFIEQVKDKINAKAGRGASGRVLELRGQLEINKDILARKQQELDSLREEYNDRKELITLQKEALEKTVELFEKQLEAVERLITIEERRVQDKRDELTIQESLQAMQRLSIEIARRNASEEERMINRQIVLYQRYADMVNDRLANAKEQLQEISDGKYEPYLEIQDNIDEIKRRIEELTNLKGLVITFPMVLKGPGGEGGSQEPVIPDTFGQRILKGIAKSLDKNDTFLSDWLAGVLRRLADPMTTDELSGLLSDVFTTMFEKTFGVNADMNKWREFFTDVGARVVTLTIVGMTTLFGEKGGEIAGIIATAIISNMRIGTPAAVQILKASADIGIAIADALTNGFVSRFLGQGQSSRKGAAGIVDAIVRLFSSGLKGAPTIVSPSGTQPSSPSAYSGTSSSTVINNTYNTSGPQYAVNASYAQYQNPSSISDDLRLVNMFA